MIKYLQQNATPAIKSTTAFTYEIKRLLHSIAHIFTKLHQFEYFLHASMLYCIDFLYIYISVRVLFRTVDFTFVKCFTQTSATW